MCQQDRKNSETVPAAPAHGCGCTPPVDKAERTVHSLQEALQVDEHIRLVGAGHDLDFPPVPFPSRRVIQSAGEARIREVVTRHHALLRDSVIAGLYPADPVKFAEATTRAADFIVEACGGTALYTPVQGHTCMRTRHFPFTIDEGAREIWLATLWQAIDDCGLPTDVREEFWNWLEAMSIRMINRRTAKAQPARFPYATMVASNEKSQKQPLPA